MTDPRLLAPLTRAHGRRKFLRSALAASAGGAAFYALGCGGGDDAAGDASPTPGAANPTPGATVSAATIKPVLLTGEFVAGAAENRFAVGLLDGENKLVKDAKVHLKFFELGSDGTTGTMRGEGEMVYEELNVDGAHVHDGTEGDAVTEDSVSFYIVNAPFDNAGNWGAEVVVTPKQGAPSTIQVPFTVLTQSTTPSIGAPAPKSRNDTAATNTTPGSICSREPACGLHDTIIGDLAGAGRPLVVMFSTPAFCATRFCGPVLEVLLAQVPAYQDRIDFVHVEVWQDFQLQKQRETVREWNLPTEPFTFFVTSQGAVAGKLEAVFSEEELRTALDQLAAL